MYRSSWKENGKKRFGVTLISVV